MDESWARQIWDAQRQTTYVLQGQSYERLRYGSRAERLPMRSGSCGDCAARRGQYHVPGCDLEKCPACGGQVISCGCAEI